MTFANLIQNNFNSGELSPLLHARNDLQVYANGLSECLNFIPRQQGGLSRRSGTLFVKEVKNNNDRVALFSFSFSNNSKFLLEFGDEYIRFYKDKQAYIVSSVHYEIASPYEKEYLFDENNVCLLTFAQSEDVIYITHKDYRPRKLKHNADNNWTIEEVPLKWGPFDALNTGNTSIYANAVSGTVTLTASAALFSASDVGSQIYLGASPDTTVKVWEVDVDYSANDIVKSGGRYYQAMSLTAGGAFAGVHKSGTVIPSHIEGIVSDGNIDWKYLHSGYGYATITGYTNATTVTASVNERLPENVVGSGNASKKWAFSAFSTLNKYPEFVTFFNDRLVFSKGIYLYFSVLGDYDNFALRDGPDLAVDMGINISVLSQEYNGVEWIYPFGDILLAGTKSSIHTIGANTTQQIFSQKNISSRQLIGKGVAPVAPIQIDSSLLFCQKSFKSLFSLSNTNDGFANNDMSLFSEHLFETGIIQIVYQERPDSILWAVRNDGKLLGFTINESQEIKGWHYHDISGGFAESLAVVDDVLFMVVKRTINGLTKRYIEYLSEYFQHSTNIEDSHFVDCGIIYDGVLTNAITGLNHLEGQSVNVLANGSVHQNATVTGGTVTLNYAVTKAHIGLGYMSRIKTLSYEGGGKKGVSNGKSKRINRVQLQLYKTVGGIVSFAENDFTNILYRTGYIGMNQPVPLFTGIQDLSIGNTYEKIAQITLKTEQPLPFNLLAIMCEMVTYER
jgi:hypothetical protein